MGLTVTERIFAYAPGREERLWLEYLEACRGCSDVNYDEVEPWAWRRLQRELKMAARRRKVPG